MSTPNGFFRCSRALFSAAKSATPATRTKPSNPTSKKTTTDAATASKSAAAPKVKKAPAGLLKSIPVSPTLRDIVGAPEISRGEAVKRLWEYIKTNNLQNPSNKKEIFCDAKLKALFGGKDKVGFLEMGKLLSPHFVKTS